MLNIKTAINNRFHNSGIILSISAIVVGNALLIASAKLQVPFYPVPMTLQTFVVIAMAMALGWKRALAVVVLYLGEGLLGLPVFAGTPQKGLGLAYMIGPTGGYLAGFLLATVICAKLAERGWDKGFISTFSCFVIGHIAIYIPGLLWLATIVGWSKEVLVLGLYPFLLGGLFKSLSGALILKSSK